jgi:hypothetical protein
MISMGEQRDWEERFRRHRFPREQWIGAWYGLLFSAAYFVFVELLPQPPGSIVFFSLLTLQGIAFAVVTWRRMRMVRVTAAGVLGAVCFGTMGWAAMNGISYLTPAVASIMGISLGAVLLLMTLSNVRDRAVWNKWAAQHERLTIFDMILMRHIPDLRGDGAAERRGN